MDVNITPSVRCLKVLEANTKDINRGFVRIGYDSIESLSASTTDAIEIIGSRRRTVAKCLPLDPHEGKDIIRIDGLIRNNAGVDIGDTVLVRKTKAIAADKVIVAPLEEIPPIDERYLTDALDSTHIIKGDNVQVPYFGGWLTFQVIHEDPVVADAVTVTQRTIFHIVDSAEKIIQETNADETVGIPPGSQAPSPSTSMHTTDCSANILRWDRILHKNVRSKDWGDVGSVESIDQGRITILGRGHSQYDVPTSLIDGFNGSEVILKISKREVYTYEITKLTKFSGQNVDLDLLIRRIEDYLGRKGFAVTRDYGRIARSESTFHIEAQSSSSLMNNTLGQWILDIVIKGAPNDFGLTFTTEWKENAAQFVVAFAAFIPLHEMHVAHPTIFLIKKALEYNLRKHITEEIDLLKNSAQHYITT